MKKYLLYVLFFFLSTGCVGQNFDIDLLKSINQNETAFKTDYSNVVSKSVTPVTIAAPVSLFVAGWATSNKKLQLDAAYFAGGYILSAIITHGTKRIVQRDRPFVTYSFIEKRDAGGSYSFPSGHTSSAFQSATALSILYPKWYVIVPSYLWATSVGWARMYQGVHYPSDVFIGAVVGAGSAWVAYKVRKRIDKKPTEKKEQPSL
ncbi:MAG TPA: phosphatase PAP2 family protein [Ferruginibacter sp.]|nr:phosphatase PAP2 family protein [Ferruginibacter sp.]HPH89792.1 phosphatase PAP2 family protein [Ferruginibacter sp.]